MSRVVSLAGRAAARGMSGLMAGATLLGVDRSYAKLATLRELRRPLVFFHWTEDEVPRLGLASRQVRFGDNVSFVVDDTLGGKLGAVILGCYGCETALLRINSRALAVRDTRSLIRSCKDLSISADGRGPYRVVNRRLPDLVRAKGAVAVPVCVRVSGHLFRCRRPWPLVVPQRGATLAVVVGEAIELDRHDGREVLARGLFRAVAEAEELLVAGCHGPLM